jgi:hypothetical protein
MRQGSAGEASGAPPGRVATLSRRPGPDRLFRSMDILLRARELQPGPTRRPVVFLSVWCFAGRSTAVYESTAGRWKARSHWKGLRFSGRHFRFCGRRWPCRWPVAVAALLREESAGGAPAPARSSSGWRAGRLRFVACRPPGQRSRAAGQGSAVGWEGCRPSGRGSRPSGQGCRPSGKAFEPSGQADTLCGIPCRPCGQLCPDGLQLCPHSRQPCPEGLQPYPHSRQPCPEGLQPYPDGRQACPEGLQAFTGREPPTPAARSRRGSRAAAGEARRSAA